MARETPQELCERLFLTFFAPLVMGGAMRPEKPIGGKMALSIGDGRPPSDFDLLSKVQLARVRVARKLAPIDLFEPAPTAAEWTIAAMLHDLVQATHPDFDAVFRRSGPERILVVIEKTLAYVPAPPNVGDALSRHSWFSRVLDLARTDVEVKWWTGKETFLGTEPPHRLTAWPDLRRVQQTRTPRTLTELAGSGSVVVIERFEALVSRLLAKSPLTDLATIARATPFFEWTHETLALVSMSAGRTMALRAFAHLPDAKRVDGALGRATRQLFKQKATRSALIAIDLLRDRALAAAVARLATDALPEPIALGAETSDASFALSAGALAASQWMAQPGSGFGDAERRAILQVLAPAANSAAAKELRTLLNV